MKSKSLFALTAILAAGIVLAPGADAQNVYRYGASASVISSVAHSPDLSINGADLSFDTRRRTGFGISAFVEWLNGAPVSILTEIGYVQRGFATEAPARDVENNVIGQIRLEDRFDYVSFAASVKVRNRIRNVSPYVLAGPAFYVKVGGDPSGEGTLSDVMATTTAGVQVGVGAEFLDARSVGLFSEVRYSRDVTNALPDVPRDLFHSSLDLRLGLRF